MAAVGLLALIATQAVAPAAARSVVTIQSGIASHTALFNDGGRTRPRLFAYTGQTTAAAALPTEVTQDLVGPTVRLPRGDLAPGIRDDVGLDWLVAGRGAPVKLNAQDQMPVFLLVAARANPYATAWYQRQESASDLWYWGGLMEGSSVSGTERSEDAVFGIGTRADVYPERDPGPATGRLVWDDTHLVRSGVATDHDPATGQDFTGTFWGNLAMPALRVEGGDMSFAQDTQAPPLELSIPVKPYGLLIESTPPSPPGVDVDWDFRFDFAKKTVTVTATVQAGSVWPESGPREGDDPSMRYWEWSPWLFFPGWDFGGLINGSPEAERALRATVAPATIRSDGSLAAPAEPGPGGLPFVPVGLLDANLPAGARLHAGSTAVDAGGLRLPSPPGALQMRSAEDPSPEPRTAEVEPTHRQGTMGLAVRVDGREIGEISVPAVTIDGVPRLLDESRLLDRRVSGPAGPGHGAWFVTSLYETDGVFLDVILEVYSSQSTTFAAYYLWDAHSSDGQPHDVALHTVMNPGIGGPGGDRFVEPFYTEGRAYDSEQKVPQGTLDFPVGALLHNWIGSLPAVEARDATGPGSILHLQLWPNSTGGGALDARGAANALQTMAYLEADTGTFQPYPEAAIADAQPIDGADVTMDLVNVYSGQIWDRTLLYYLSYFYLEPD